MKAYFKGAVIFSLLFVLLSASPSFAISLDEAKGNRLVGEQANGYLGSPSGSPSGEVSALIADINAKRRSHYESIAKKNGTSMTAVEKLAGKTAIEKTPAGQFIRLPSGEWRQK